MIDPTPMSSVPPSRTAAANPALYAAAQKFEANFLAEMLRATNLGKPPETFGGGAGESHFSSFLVQSYAERMTAAGGIGLADHVYDALENRT